MTKEIPILFNTEMVRAILDGRKTQTRRPCKYISCLGDPEYYCEKWSSDQDNFESLAGPIENHSPFGQPGDILWVRETTGLKLRNDGAGGSGYFMVYKADNPEYMCYDYRPIHGPTGAFLKMKWTPSIHMPKSACRLKLKVKRVWVEIVKDISENDAQSEGMRFMCECGGEIDLEDITSHWACEADDAMQGGYKVGFQQIWHSIYGTWDNNPWVWCCEFEVINND